jgi:hypothetical protein
LGRVGSERCQSGVAHRDELLEQSEALPQDDWNFGNSLHDGHIIRGYARLLADDIEGAKAELRAAGKHRGRHNSTPLVRISLWRGELLQRGEGQAALEYFHDISRFWAPTGSLERAKKHRSHTTADEA